MKIQKLHTNGKCVKLYGGSRMAVTEWPIHSFVYFIFKGLDSESTRHTWWKRAGGISRNLGRPPLERTRWKVKGRQELSRPSERGPIGFSLCVCLFLLPIEGDVRGDGCHSVCGPLRTGPGSNSSSTPQKTAGKWTKG